MKCPFCSHPSDKVVDSREVHDSSVIRRRRECLGCGKRFTSYERIEEIPLMVIKKDGRRERFDRHKILAGLLKACEKRPVPTQALDEIVDEIEGRLQDRPEREIAVEEIGSHVMARLRDLDQVAYVRFASVYRHFQDINEFMHELEGLLRRREKEG